MKRVFLPCYRFLTFQTLGSRFFWIIVSTSLLSAVLYGLVVAKVWGEFVDTSTQKVNYHLAEELVELISVKRGADTPKKAQSVLADIAELFPGIDLYLYSDSKKQLTSSTEVFDAVVNTAPLEAFLSSNGDFERPITLSPEPFPRLQRLETYPFSSAKLMLDGTEYYLIAILGGSRNVSARAASSKQHLKVFGYYLLASVMFTGCVLLLLVLALLPSRLRRMSLILREFQNGNYSRRINDSSSDELGMYARSFDSMAETIEHTMKHLTSQDELRRTLVADVSHELRRPLTVLNLSLETMIADNDTMPSNQRKQHLDQALACGENLSQKISNLFALSRLEARVEPPQLRDISTKEVLSDVVSKLEALAREKDISVEFELNEDIQNINADETLLQQALLNLLENAIKHSPRGTVITLSAKKHKNKAHIAIRDQGSGIPSPEVPHIFDRFFKGSKANPEGGGLGLAIAKRIIEIHGSRLNVESKLHVGTTFSFCLDTD